MDFRSRRSVRLFPGVRLSHVLQPNGETESGHLSYAAIFDAFEAGRRSIMREEWMRLARDGDPKLRRMHVALARNAHRAYLHFLRSAVRRNTG